MQRQKEYLVEYQQNEQNFHLILQGILSKEDFEAVNAYHAQGMSLFDAQQKVSRTLRKRLQRFYRGLKASLMTSISLIRLERFFQKLNKSLQSNLKL